MLFAINIWLAVKGVDAGEKALVSNKNNWITYTIKPIPINKTKHIAALLFLFFTGFKSMCQQVAVNDSICIVESNDAPAKVMGAIDVKALHFYKAAGRRINFNIVGNSYKYVVFKLNAASTLTDQYLSIDNTSLDTIAIFNLVPGGTNKLLYLGGSLVPCNDTNKYVWHTAHVMAGAGSSYYFIALKAVAKIINVRYDIMSKDDLQQKYLAYGRVVFFYMGAVSIIILIIVLAWLLFKQRVFAAYLGYIFFVSCWMISHYGYLFPYVYPQLPMMNEIVKPVCTLLACYFLMMVLKQVFTQQLKTQQWLMHLFNWALLVLPLITASMLVLLVTGSYNTLIKATLIATWHAALFFSIFILVFTPFYFIRSGFTARLFSFSMGLVCIVLFVQLLCNSGLINNFFLCEHGAAMGSLLESFVMAFGLFHNLLEEKKLKEQQLLLLQTEQTETFEKLITVQDNERKRIAGDLHDNIGPLLAALKINFRRLVHAKDVTVQYELVAKTESIIDDSIAEIRNVAHNLMPKGLSANGLINTLVEYFEGIQQLYNKTIVFDHHIHAVLNPDLQINVYRIICELVLNAARHSNAVTISVNIKADHKCVSLSINDDGQGFVVSEDNNNKSLGLQNTESRILYLKGKYCLTTQPGKGTLIDIEIPLQLN